MRHKVLNLGAGKLNPISVPTNKVSLIVNLDQSYYVAENGSETEILINDYKNRRMVDNKVIYCKEDAFEFMERTTIQFDQVCMYRFLEHIPFDRVLYFIYLVSTVTKPSGFVDVIVPNYFTLAQAIVQEHEGLLYSNAFEKYNILVTTELLNEPGCPHASIWTPLRIKKFWELEDRFEVESVIDEYKFDGRDIYLRAIIKRK